MRHEHGNSSIWTENGMQFLHLNEKDHYSTGYAYGMLILKSKNPVVKFLKKKGSKILLSLLYQITKKYYKNLKIPQEYLDELKGYADSTKIPYNHLFCLNFCSDIMKKFGFHCSTISVFNKNSVLVGRNTDLLPFLTRMALKHAKSIVVKVTIPKKKSFTHVSIPFFVGAINGFNEKGISVNSHQIISVREKTNKKRLTNSLLMRKCLEEVSNLKEGEALIKKNIPMRSLSLALTSEKEKKGIIFEINPNKMNMICPKGTLCCTTHFESKDMRKLHNGLIVPSQIRLKSMKNLTKKKKNISSSELINILKDHSNGLNHKTSGKSLTNNGTYQSFVFDLTNNLIFISNGNKKPASLTGEYLKFNVNNKNKKNPQEANSY
jgi:hypothetical protein